MGIAFIDVYRQLGLVSIGLNNGSSFYAILIGTIERVMGQPRKTTSIKIVVLILG